MDLNQRVGMLEEVVLEQPYSMHRMATALAVDRAGRDTDSRRCTS